MLNVPAIRYDVDGSAFIAVMVNPKEKSWAVFEIDRDGPVGKPQLIPPALLSLMTSESNKEK